jgi:hypothetical protein
MGECRICHVYSRLFCAWYNAMVEVHLPVCVNMGSSDIICLFQKFKDTNMQNYLWMHKILWLCYSKCLWIQFCSHTISSCNLPCFRYMIINYLWLSHWCKNVLSVKSYWESSHYLQDTVDSEIRISLIQGSVLVVWAEYSISYFTPFAVFF